MNESQIADDIDKWGAGRMKQWLNDLMQRYAMADIPQETAVANTGAMLLVVSARLIAISNVPEKQAGEVFGSLVASARKELRKPEKEMNDGSS